MGAPSHGGLEHSRAARVLSLAAKLARKGYVVQTVLRLALALTLFEYQTQCRLKLATVVSER
jgi:hypothetical protein